MCNDKKKYNFKHKKNIFQLNLNCVKKQTKIKHIKKTVIIEEERERVKKKETCIDFFRFRFRCIDVQMPVLACCVYILFSPLPLTFFYVILLLL